MTIRDFETIAKAIAEVVFFEDEEKEVFIKYCDKVHERDFEADGEYAYENICNNLVMVKEGWENEVSDDDRVKFIGNRIFDAMRNISEAKAASYGG